MVEALVDPVADRPVGEEAGEAAADGVEQLRLACNVQVALVLPREARGRQILRRRGAADRDRQLRAVFANQLRVCGSNLSGEILGQGSRIDQLPGTSRAACQIRDVTDIDRFEMRLLDDETAELLFIPTDEDRKELAAEGIGVPKPMRLKRIAR